MAIDLVSRAEWGARKPKGGYGSLRSTRGVKVHYTGGRVDPKLVDDHDRCVAMVRAIQRMHMDSNGWIDIGYTACVCPHRKVFVGRGPHALPAANGPGLNSGHYAVLGLVGNAGLVEPNDAMLLGILDAVDYLRKHGGAGREIKGHRDGYSTDCPGGPLYAWIRKGAPRPKPHSKPEPVPAAQPTSRMEALVKDLPVLRPGDEDRHVKTMRCLLFARGYEPANLHSFTYEGEDLFEQVRAFKAAKKVPSGVDDLVWDARCWEAALT